MGHSVDDNNFVEVVTTQDITTVMLGRVLTFGEICEGVFGCYPNKVTSRRLIRIRIVNLKDSKNAVLLSEKRDGQTYWHLVSVASCYFRRDSLTRGGTPRTDPPKSPYIRPRPQLNTHELEACRLANFFNHLLYELRERQRITTR